jgi:2-polyprenyl-6-methoxyphenol hydroxylase-like FAD-dependent oxidoreductase
MLFRGTALILSSSHGHPSMLFMRRDLMEVFYSKLPNRERYVVPNKKVSDIEQDDTSVMVTCADGSVFKGDVLIGCDGVHSIVRRLVFEQPDQQQTRLGSEYRGLFGSCPRPEGIAPCNITETHNRDVVFMILCTDDTAFWLVTNRKDKFDSQRYTSEDVQALVQKFRDHSVAPGGKVTFGHLWEARNKVPGPGMYDYNEGIAEQWCKGRVVIVGDAAHRVSSLRSVLPFKILSE